MPAYDPLMKNTEETVRVYLDPVEAKRLVTRLRKVSFFLYVNLFLVTEFDEEDRGVRGYNLDESIKASAAQVHKVLDAKIDFNRRKAEQGQNTGKIKVSRLGHCLFIGA